MFSWRGSARWVVGLGLALALLSASSASAQGRPRAERADRLASPVHVPTSDWAVDLMLSTAVPTALGAELRIETPGRLLLSVFAGGNPYADALGGLVQSYGGGTIGQTLVTSIGQSAGLFRLQAGWRPSPDAGLELLVGYTLMYSTPVITRATLEGLTGQSFAFDGFDSTHLTVAIHAVSAELGWRFVIADHFVVRIGIGGTFTVDSSAHLDVPDAMRRATSAVGDTEALIARSITQYGFVPEGRLAVGYRF